MGYNTDFSGELLFISPLSGPEITALSKMLGEDCRAHPEWGCPDLTYIDLCLTDNCNGLEWDHDTEKTYDLTEKVNLVIREMRKVKPDFKLSGTLDAQGEDPDDRWKLVIGADGWASREVVKLVPVASTCPHCGKPIS